MIPKSLFKTAVCFLFAVSYIPHPSLGGFLKNLVFSMENMHNVARGGFDFISHLEMNDLVEELVETSPKNKSWYDFIVVGAGSAGSVVASRLSEVNATVLLIEAGGQEDALMDIPLIALYLQQYKSINWNYTLKKSPNYCRGMINGQCRLPRGKVMGGCSVLNLMIATRASRSDYDNWANNLGCEGWSWKDVRGLFLKMEHFVANNTRASPRDHGTGGPLNVASAPYRTGAADAFVEAGRERGFPYVDYDGPQQIGYSYTYVTQKNGARHSSNRAYLTPNRNRRNLFVTRNSHVDKIIIRNGTAKGVIFTKNLEKLRVYARKEIILCAGAINSPKVLMLSGIGPARHLRKLGIGVKKNSRVGYNLQDHISYWGLNYLVNSSVTVVTSEIFKLNSPAIGDYMDHRSGPLTISGGIEAAGFIDVNDLQSRTTTANMELIYVGVSLASDPVAHRSLGISPEHYQADLAPMLNKQSFMIVPTLLTPKSRGRVYLRSKNPSDDPVIHPNYFSDQDDMRRMILGIRESNRLVRTRAMRRIGARLPRKLVRGCERFRRDSDDYWDCAVRTYADTLYHPTGTCKMGAENDPTAVVDPRLRVIGIKGLRVADASIMPEIVAGHTNLPTMMIGEKLADMVKKDWNFL